MAAANDSDAISTVAVIGAGIMGSAMARNLVAAGLNTRVWDRSAAATGPLAEAGAMVTTSAREAVRDAQVVITMLPTADAVESVIFDGGVAAAFADGCVWAQMGTIGVEATFASGTGWPGSGPTCCSWTPRCPAARGPRSRVSC